MTELLHHLIFQQALRTPDAPAVHSADTALSYQMLAESVRTAAGQFLALGLMRGDRVAVYLDKRPETVIALMATAAAGGIFVPVNPLLKAGQVAHVLNDCKVKLLVTSASRLERLGPILAGCAALSNLLIVGEMPGTEDAIQTERFAWDDASLTESPVHRAVEPHRVIDTDPAAILYTSGSTGQPKGVVLSHRNLVAGALSVATYLDNRPDDRILALLPLSFDYGLSQLTTAFHVGACVVLMNYLLPRDVPRMVEKERITGLAAVPPLWIQLAELDWPAGTDAHLRYITNSGGTLPAITLARLRAQLPRTKPYLMYGLTEAFRSTYLPPEELERRPGSMGKAIPNAEILVVRKDGSACAPDEPGELVHRGAHVALGYWNDPARTAERFRPAPGQPAELAMTEIAVWSGDRVRMDVDGYLYFIGREDEMIKTSGYRVSPTEVEEVVYRTGLVSEAVAFGTPHPVLGQSILLITYSSAPLVSSSTQLMDACKQQLPAYMVPARIIDRPEPLPRTANGKIDRKHLAREFSSRLDSELS